MTSSIEFFGKAVMNEIVGEDYVGNKRREKEAALTEAIDGAITDCVITVVQMLEAFYAEKNPSWQRVAEVHQEARDRIKKFLK